MSASRAPQDESVDVVVVGSGAAGCAAAIEASRAGAQVVVLEKMDREHAGGNTRVSGGVWFVQNDPDRARVYLEALSGTRPPPGAIADVWSVETAQNTRWIESLGGSVEHLAYHRQPEFPMLDGSGVYEGFHSVDGSWGRGRLHAFLMAAVEATQIPVRFETPAVELVSDEDGRVSGVVTAGPDGRRFLAARRGVVLATGGFENDPVMVERHLGLPGATPWGSPANTGDGHRMAESVGAATSHMDNHMPIMGLRAPGFGSAFTVHLPASGGSIHVNAAGTRFADETLRNCHGHVYDDGRHRLAFDAPTWVIFDERTRTAGPICQPASTAPFGWNNLIESYEWSDDNQREIDNGWIETGRTPSELAARLGLDGPAVESAVARYNAGCATGEDAFGRPPETLLPLDQPPFYGFSWGPVIAYTCGGPTRDETGQVLDERGGVVEGLFVAGELSSSYSFCMDGGMMIADALAFGRVAGRSAAARSG